MRQKFTDRIICRFVMWYMQKQLDIMRKHQDTPYIHIIGTGKDKPKFLMYTDDRTIKRKMYDIY